MNELALTSSGLPMSRELSDDIVTAELLARSGFFPDCRTTAEAFAKLRAGREFGIGPVTALKELYVVKGKVALSAALIGALIRRSGSYDFEIVEHTDETATIKFTRAAPDGGREMIGVSTFTLLDAEQAGLLQSGPLSPWQKYRRNMLLSRALTNGCRWFCPDVLMGAVYTPEEVMETASGRVEGTLAPPTPALPPPGKLREMYQQETLAADYYGVTYDPLPADCSDEEIMKCGLALHERVQDARESRALPSG